MLKSIREQMKPDEGTVSELMKKIDDPEGGQAAVKKPMPALSAAACAAVCIALLLFSRSDKPQTKETVELSAPDSTVQVSPDSSVQDITLDSEREQTAQEDQTEALKLKLIRCNADEVILGEESAKEDFSDEKQKQAFLEANKQIEFDGTVYGFVKECDENIEDIANLSCNIGKDSDNEWAAASFAYASDKKRIAVYNAKRPSGHYYIFESIADTESEMTGIALSWQAGYIYPAYERCVVNEQLSFATSAALGFLSEKNNVEYNGEMYTYTGLYDGEFTGKPAPIEYNVDVVVDGYGTIDILYSDGGTSKIYFCYYQPDEQTLLARLIDGTVIKFEKNNTETVTVPELKGMTVEEAEAALEECGLAYAVESSGTEGDPGRVTDQSIAAGEEVSIGSTVTIFVEADTEEQQQKPYTVNSAVMTVSKVYSEDSEVYREEIMRLISEEEKHAQLSAAKSFKFNGETYEYCGSSAEKDCISTGTETSRIIGSGSINVDGVVSDIWFCSVGSEPTGKRIAVDLGDRKGVIFENKSYKAPEKTDVSLTLYKSDYPIDTRTDEYIEYSLEDTLEIFDALGEIEFDGRRYEFTGEVTDDVVLEYIAIGTIKYNGKSNSVYGAYRSGFPAGEQLLIDLGNWRYCVMQAIE